MVYLGLINKYLSLYLDILISVVYMLLYLKYINFSKKWSQSYVKLCGSNLVFFKNQLAAKPQPGSPHGRPDFLVRLHGAQIEKNTGEKSSKKNVISVSILNCPI